MTGEHRRLPRRAFVALGVAQEAEHAPLGAVEPRGERGAARGREPLAERAAREVDAAELSLGMRAEQRAVPRERVELVLAQQSAQVQRGVERERRVALREHEPVPAGIVGADAAQNAAVEDRDEVGDRERRADVAHVRALRLLQHDASDLAGEDLRTVGHAVSFPHVLRGRHTPRAPRARAGRPTPRPARAP